MTVTINSWIGDKFLNDNMCDECGNPTSTVSINVGLPFGNYDICKGCLLKLVLQIDQAILESKKAMFNEMP